MSVTQAMEWLIEHADDPAVDAPLPGQFLVENAAGTDVSTTQAVAGASRDVNREEPKDDLTEIFKKIRRKREFRPDPRVLWGGSQCISCTISLNISQWQGTQS
ncbi:UNVERIFIED_CONTAM: Ubiquitin-associated domain-containing protein 1 [Gekko kuhli]